MKKALFILAAGVMVSAIIIGCSTEKPWEPGESPALELLIVSAPDASTVIPENINVGFSWNARGGNGNYGFQWYVTPIESDWNDASSTHSATYQSMPADTFTFNLRVTDTDNNTASTTFDFIVSVVVDISAPSVAITQSPAESSYVATGTSVSFAWEGDDGYGNNDMIEYQYAFPTMADSSGWGQTLTYSEADVASADPATFYVRGRDGDSNISAWESVSFVIRPATILYIDDFQWLDANGNPDMPKERNQKQFYRDALEGYAFAEWDIAAHIDSLNPYGLPDTSDLVDAGVPIYSTIIFCADSDIGTTDGTPWYWLGDHDGYDGAAMRYHLENGGNLLLAGALAVLDMSNNYGGVVATNDFEFEWLGVDTVAWAYDYWYWFTWAMKDTLTALDLPDSMKIDVAKNGDQDDYAMEFPGLRDDAEVTSEVIFTWGPWVDPDDPPPPLGNPVGYITSFDGTPQTANLAFDVYSMPPDAIRLTFQTILGEFGE